MTLPPFPQTVIAVIWDFDKTLLPGYMQDPLFNRYGVDGNTFWKEVQGLARHYRDQGNYRVSEDTIYLSHILSYVREGVFDGLTNEVLKELGSELKFYPGVPEIFSALEARVTGNERFARHEISVEHYIVSTGLRQIIVGSAVNEHVEGVWACEFVESVAEPGYLTKQTKLEADSGVISEIAYAIDNTTKTRAVFEINKGVNKHDEISVNDSMDDEARRVPFKNMLYIADGPSDVPVFSVLNRFGGETFGVYKAESEPEFRQITSLSREGRVQGCGPADYTVDSHTGRSLSYAVDRIATAISERRERALGDSIGKSPGHILE